MSSASVWDSSASQDVPPAVGSEHRNARVKRVIRISSIVAQEVSAELLVLGQGGGSEAKPAASPDLQKSRHSELMCDA